MVNRKGFVLILQSGAGGYLGHSEEADVCNHASYFDGDGWVFHFEFDNRLNGRHRRSRPVVKLQLIAPFGCPNASAMPTALAVAGMRHCVSYLIDGE